MTGHAPRRARSDDLAYLTMEDLAVRVAAYRCWESRLFALTGSWAPLSSAHPVATVLLDRFSAEHAWHAQLWSERQPLPVHLSSLAASAPPAPVPAFLQRLEEIGTTAGLERRGPVVLGVLARCVLPRVVATYRAHLAQSDAVSAGPEVRVLRHVLADEIAEWQDAEFAVQALVARSPAALRAAIGDACGQLEDTVASVGEGLLRWRPGPGQGGPGLGS